MSAQARVEPVQRPGQRILAAAQELFYWHGINATGVEQLAAHAHVSKRTLYQHFAGKDDLVAAYLLRFGEELRSPPSMVLRREDLPARQRLIGVFDPAPGSRGCPYLNASAEIADVDHPARAEAKRGKQAFIAELIRVAAEAGARDPAQLGNQLAILSDGARAQSNALQSDEPMDHARDIAEVLIDTALGSILDE
jgi:AcrR family transcriptional regulator